MSKIKYDGHELEYFDSAFNFRNYQLKLIKNYLSDNFAEVGPGRGEFVNYYQRCLRSIELIEPDVVDSTIDDWDVISFDSTIKSLSANGSDTLYG